MTEYIGHDFVISGTTARGEDCAVYMDGKRLSGVQSFQIQSDAGGINRITITLVARSINPAFPRKQDSA